MKMLEKKIHWGSIRQTGILGIQLSLVLNAFPNMGKPTVILSLGTPLAM
jgi:hypothetical protein